MSFHFYLYRARKAHDRWSGLGPNPAAGPYLDVLLNEEAPGK